MFGAMKWPMMCVRGEPGLGLLELGPAPACIRILHPACKNPILTFYIPQIISSSPWSTSGMPIGSCWPLLAVTSNGLTPGGDPTSRNRASKPSTAIIQIIQACQSLPKPAKACQSLPKPAKACQSLPKPAKACQSLPKPSSCVLKEPSNSIYPLDTFLFGAEPATPRPPIPFLPQERARQNHHRECGIGRHPATQEFMKPFFRVLTISLNLQGRLR
ncbi:hypothetical protein E6O75_ATG10497 [Venturia nashicola]|uniref:Uncharacterized protein n=1 Tax=Venturia nashicola TaxID=86259 RepID=A0A4Z1NWI1_9PEZI|nr:hypothetical protein E6O75_ATG10497 [Venturia nashicola]